MIMGGSVHHDVAPQVHRQDCHANKHRTANDEPLRQVGIHNCIENTHQKRSVCGFDACASFKPRFSHGERARRPRNQLDDDGVDKGSDVQSPQKTAAARHCPAQRHPATPKQVQEQDAFRQNSCRKNRTGTPLCRANGYQLSADSCIKMKRCADFPVALSSANA
jgi:hypothetical protein